MSDAALLDQAVVWAGGSVRIGAMLVAAPVFGHPSVPGRVRVGLAFMLFIGVVGAPPEAGDLLSQGSVAVAAALAQEALLGFTLALAMRLLFSAFSLAGEFASIQGGLGAARTLDPTTGQSSVALASLFDIMMLLVYLNIDGHHMLVGAIARSYEIVPFGTASVGAVAWLDVVALGGRIFEVAVQLAAPVTVAMMVSNVALGILAKVAPQLNLMTVQLPAHIAMALAIVSFGAANLVDVAAQHMDAWNGIAMEAVMGVP